MNRVLCQVNSFDIYIQVCNRISIVIRSQTWKGYLVRLNFNHCAYKLQPYQWRQKRFAIAARRFVVGAAVSMGNARIVNDVKESLLLCIINKQQKVQIAIDRAEPTHCLLVNNLFIISI